MYTGFFCSGQTRTFYGSGQTRSGTGFSLQRADTDRQDLQGLMRSERHEMKRGLKILFCSKTNKALVALTFQLPEV